MIPPFTLEGYVETVRGVLARGYELRSFHDAEPSRRHLVLRHDIDQSIPRARALAEREASQGWTSSFFVLVRTQMYNPWAPEASADLRAMIAMGHEIGLHLDATCYDSPDALDAGAIAECRALEEITGQPVRLISFHRPARELVGADQPVAGRLHSYMPRFTRDMGYSSDSRGEWRHGHVWEHPALADGRALQLLTHAIWWVGPEGQSPRERLADVLEEIGVRLDAELATNNDMWRRTGA